jgi:hypothetical protein
MTIATEFGITHAHPETDEPDCRQWTVFALDVCEGCGGPVQAPNAVGLSGLGIAKLLAEGLRIWRSPLPPELGAYEDGSYGCERCM